MLQTIIAGLIAVLIGLAFLIFGYRIFRFLLPIWGFLVGFGLGASWAQSVVGSSFLGDALSWIFAIGIGLILGGLAYFFHTLGIVLLGASIGGGLFAFLAQAFGMNPGFALNMVALVGAVIFGVFVYWLRIEKMLVVVLLSAAGATGVVTGLLLWFGRLNLADLGTTGVLQPILSTSWLWLAAWVVITTIGILLQFRGPQLRYA